MRTNRNRCTSLANWALAKEGGHAVVTRGPVEADGRSAVIDVLAAVVSSPAIDAHAGVSTDCVEACTTVVTSIGLHKTLVDILCTILS